uniref:Peptidyl-prolyl cis-trans isomerase n=1 Tax=Kalanchoe fedtschenkoi TaxID=63787 RepID=A0A7N0VJN8_KALFE
MDSHTADDTSMSDGSRFFISTATDEWLDGKQVVFGQVVEGFEFVREIMWSDGHYAQIAECGQLNS